MLTSLPNAPSQSWLDIHVARQERHLREAQEQMADAVREGAITAAAADVWMGQIERRILSAEFPR